MNAPPQVIVEHLGDDRFALLVRGHAVVVDQPDADGGLDAGPTPTELLVGALAGCVAFYARRYLARHHLPQAGLAVTTSYAMAADRPARIADLDVRVDVPPGLTAEQRRALLAVASHCTVHNTLRQPPRVAVELAGDDAVA